MIVILFLTLTLILALAALQMFRRAFFGSPRLNWPRLILALALSGFVYLYGAWIYLSAYGRYAFALAVLGMCAYGATRVGKVRKLRPLPQRPVRHLSIAALLIVLDVLYFSGMSGSHPIAELRFPLKAGRYFVLQGGKGLPANIFHFNSRRATYAMDIVRLDGWGRRSRQVFSLRLADYFIFGDTVFSPCDGMIERAVSDNPDNIPPTRKRGPNNLNGVVIGGLDYTVYLGHLQQHGVFVKAGDRVLAGQPLGLVGNSGMSLEPHLHIQVHSNSPAGAPWYRRPQLFIRFNGKGYLLFEEIDAR